MDTLYNLLESYGLQSITIQSVALRLLMATIFGGVLGLERSQKRRAAGFRTYLLVCVSSAVVMMTGQYMQTYLGGTDPARIAAQDRCRLNTSACTARSSSPRRS